MPALTAPGAGRRCNQGMQTVTSVDFQEMPLTDVIDYLKHKFGIEIQLDPKGLSEESLGPSTPITKNLNNVKLRYRAPTDPRRSQLGVRREGRHPVDHVDRNGRQHDHDAACMMRRTCCCRFRIRSGQRSICEAAAAPGGMPF